MKFLNGKKMKTKINKKRGKRNTQNIQIKRQQCVRLKNNLLSSISALSECGKTHKLHC